MLLDFLIEYCSRINHSLANKVLTFFTKQALEKREHRPSIGLLSSGPRPQTLCQNLLTLCRGAVISIAL